MAYGVIKVIQPQTHTQILVQSGNVPYKSARVLNPNDGVVYVARNRDCLSPAQGDWEWKIPSQSYAVLPGEQPGFSTLGLYYVDQSGGNRPGEITVYPSFTESDDPVFVAIGRAALTSQTTMDIAQGNQPVAPPLGFGRLWIDGSNDLHIMSSTGVDNLVLDQSNYLPYVQGTALVGDVGGTIGANVINANAVTTTKIANGAVTLAKFGTFDVRGNPWSAQDITADRGNGTGVYYFSTGGNKYLYWDGTNFTLQMPSGYLNVVGDIRANGGNNSVWATNHYLGTSGSYYLALTGGNYLYAVNMNIMSGGTLCLSANSGINWSWNGTIRATHQVSAPSFNADGGYALQCGNTNLAIYMSGTNGTILQFNCYGNPNLYRFYNSQTGYYVDCQIGSAWQLNVSQPISSPGFFVAAAPGSMQFNQGRNTSEVQLFIHAYDYGSMYIGLDCSATSYATRSSEKYKSNLATVQDGAALARVLDPRVSVYSFDYVIPESHKEADASRPDESSRSNPSRIGFLAEEMHLVVPEALAYTVGTGEPDGIAYGELTSLLWGAVRALSERMTRAGIAA